MVSALITSIFYRGLGLPNKTESASRRREKAVTYMYPTIDEFREAK